MLAVRKKLIRLCQTFRSSTVRRDLHAVKTLESYTKLAYIGNRNEPKSVMTLPHTINSGTPARNTFLLFHRIGNTYFLSQFWAEGSRVGLPFRQSPEEKELAMNETKASTVSVAANLEQ